MKQKLRVMNVEDFDLETNALAVCAQVLRQLTFDQQWRVINYLLIRLIGRSWQLPKPKSDQEK